LLVVPISNYVFDPGGLWIPQVGGPGGTTVEFNGARIASFLSSLLAAVEVGTDEARAIQAMLGWIRATISPETDDDVLTVDLGVARAVPGVEILTPEGDSLAGRSLTIQKLTGSAIIRLGSNAVQLTPLTDVEYGTLEFVALTKKMIRTAGDWRTAGALNYSRPGTRITIAGSGANNGTYTVVSATATDLVVVEALVDEVASATETVTGLYPKRAATWDALAYPNMVTFSDRRFSRLFVENAAQAGQSMTIIVGKA